MAKILSNPTTIIVTPPQVPLSSWVPAVGTFANISKNTLASAAPAGYGGEATGPFANWSGGRLNPDYSPLGGYVVYGSGHLQTGAVLWSAVNVFDISTLTWETRCVPTTLWAEGQADKVYAQFPDGTPYPPHTYGGLEIQSAANSGMSQGALINFFAAGASDSGSRRVNRFNLSQPVGTFGAMGSNASINRVIDNIATTGEAANYPMTAFDSTRNVYWLLPYNGNGPLFSIDAQSFAMTSYPNGQYNEYGCQFMVYMPPPYDALLAFGRSGPNGVNMSFWVTSASSPNTPFTNITNNVVGALPNDHQCGGGWSVNLGCVVMYEAGGSSRVHQLMPPSSGNLQTGTWTLSNQTLTGVGGAVPCQNTVASNGAWGRFVEAPACGRGVFIWCDSITGPVQAWRLSG